MNRFKKWIIHKLGGCCVDDILPTAVVTKEFPIKTYSCIYSINKYANTYAPDDKIDEILYRSLGYELLKNRVGHIQPEFNYFTGCVDYKLSIDVVDKK